MLNISLKPRMITAADGTVFRCTVENVGGRGLRWVFVSSDRWRFDGGIYAAAEGLEAIQARFHDWWHTSRALVHAGIVRQSKRVGGAEH